MVDAATNQLQAVRLDGLVPVEYAYHVTNVLVNEDQPNPPNWTTLQWQLADDPTYDGELVGFPCVFFTTTLYQGNLPDITMYPRGGTLNQNYWRVAIPLKYFEGYRILYCHRANRTGVRQVRLVLAREPLATQLREILGWNEEVARNYLRMEQNGENTTWYSTEYRPTQNKETFVNFVIFDDVDISREGVLWSQVRHTLRMPGVSNRPKLRDTLISAMVAHRQQERQLAGPGIPE